MLLNSTDFIQISNIDSLGHVQTIQNVNKDTSPSQEHPQSSSTPAKTPEMSSIFERVLDAFKLNRFQPNLNIASSGHMHTIQNVIKDTSPSQEHQNHHQLRPEFLKCHRSLRGFLMPSNLLNFNQILHIITPSGHVQAMQNIIKDSSPSQEHENHPQLHQEFQKCHQSLRGFLMPSNSTDIDQILNKVCSQHDHQFIQL